MGSGFGKRVGPDFLGIGAQRAGTTWLTQNLRQHPEIWMPPLKELHYFDRFYQPTPSLLTVDSLFNRIFGWGHDSIRWRQWLKKRLRRSIKRRDWRELSWNLRFFFGRYSDRWYASLFEGDEAKVTGEVTPAYSILEPADIEHISQIMPDIKLLFIVRNPIDRAWSSIRYSIWRSMPGRTRQRDEPIEALPLEAYKQVTETEAFVLRGDYVRTITNWKRFFSEGQFFFGFFEDIVEDPKRLLSDVFAFLGVDPSEEHITDVAFERVNRSPDKLIPLELRVYLAEQYYPQVAVLSQMLGGRAMQWKQELEGLLQLA